MSRTAVDLDVSWLVPADLDAVDALARLQLQLPVAPPPCSASTKPSHPLQVVVRRVGRAISQAVPTERLYILSLGSNSGNAHVHWHLAPLPPGVPYQDQQLRALMASTNGFLQMSTRESTKWPRGSVRTFPDPSEP